MRRPAVRWSLPGEHLVQAGDGSPAATVEDGLLAGLTGLAGSGGDLFAAGVNPQATLSTQTVAEISRVHTDALYLEGTHVGELRRG